jgi:hypothetical protein
MSNPRQIVPGNTYLITRRALRRHYLLRPEYVVSNLFIFFLAVLGAKYGIAIKALKAFRSAYRAALKLWRTGTRSVQFPQGTWWMASFHGAAVAETPISVSSNNNATVVARDTPSSPTTRARDTCARRAP